MARRNNIGRFAAVALLCCLRLRGGAAQYAACTNGAIDDIGNGLCDAANNNPSCGYDGGDCCPCTCADGPVHSCVDRDSTCIFPGCDGPLATSENPICNEGSLSDGVCDDENNTPSCNYDGGDCCGCTCGGGDPGAVCGLFGFNCRDPTCFDPTVVAQFPECTGDWLMIGDGICQEETNNPSCGYDGGDCCLCSCSGKACAIGDFDCLDPDVDDELYECKAPPPAALPCSAEVQRVWVVDDSAQALALTAAVNCSGGSFEVEWRGSVVVTGPIFVANGTTLTVTGVGSNALINGNASTRLFTVVNAALHVSGVNITHGVSTVGGAIAAERSILTFDQTNFIGNRAAGNGGAVYVSDGSSVSCVGGNFVNNGAGSEGGAMYVTGSSVASCGGSWLSNVAGLSAGALMVDGGSNVSWSYDTVFAYNAAARHGGAVYAVLGSSVSWSAPTVFYSNSAWSIGGAMYISHGSSTSWTGAATFDSNIARSSTGAGGALGVSLGSNASWSGVTTFLSNVAGGSGGGVLIYNDSSASWSDVTSYTNNVAGETGGGLFALESSHVSCGGEETTSTFFNNSAANGGALAAQDNSSIFIRGSSSFDSNSAIETSANGTGFGGAVLITFSSTATWSGRLAFTGNTAAIGGGALYSDHSNISWKGAATMTLNKASIIGGVFYARHSSVSWSGETDISNNSGGAVVLVSSTVSWRGYTTLAHNHEALFGGALGVNLGSSVFWSGGATRFIENSANWSGGALNVRESEVSWSGDTEFVGNSCEYDGGALDVDSGSSVWWSEGTTIFSRNYALNDGTIAVSGSNVSWSGATEFVGNTAEGSGGAIFVGLNAHVCWTGDTNFTSNEAGAADGGAVAAEVFSSRIDWSSILAINGSTRFFNNTAGANGGGLALLGECSLHIDTVDISFVGNHAAVAGGAVFLSGAGVGPVLTDARFISNSAEVGGAAAIFGSGHARVEGKYYPTTFYRCSFIGNRATATGGAINSAAGQDAIVGSVFEGNSAGTGGALRLAGTASVYNCSFVENTSDEGGGPAVSNIGFISGIGNISFSGNGLDCPSMTFRDYVESDDPFEAVCNGCETTCDGCILIDGRMVPICTEAMDHSTSNGGNITLDALSIQRGYWRATASSTEVLACYHADACVGGVTGTSGYCLDGYEGPYCSVCSDGYSAQLSFTCSKCAENSAAGIAVAAVVAIVTVIVAAAVVSYVMSGETGLGAGQGVIERLTRYIPLQSVKIVIVAWQILTQFASVANVTYPDVYQDFLNGLDVFNFDLGWVLSAGCVFDVGFHDRLLIATTGPITALLFLACTYAAAVHANRGNPESIQNIRHKHVSMVLLLTFLVYSSVSSTVFKAFACEELDDGKNYLRSDYRVECDSSKHKGFQVYAGLMVVLYTAGIPALYFGLLFRDRDVLKKKEGGRGEDPPRVTSTSGLWKPYKPTAFYYEVIECGRRILLSGVIVFIYPNTAAQIAVTLMVAFAFTLLSESLAPFSSRWDAWISRMGHVVVFVSMYVALLLKVDVSDERASSQKVFEAVLVAVHACMVLAVVVEAIVLSCSFKVGQWGTPSPRSRGGRSLSRVGGRGRGKGSRQSLC